MLKYIIFVSVISLSWSEDAKDVLPSKTEYERYLDQMLMALRDDPKAVKLLKEATHEDIQNGVVERTLRRLHPEIRSKLDEVKRGIISEYRNKLRRMKMDDKVPDDIYKFSDDDLKHLLRERQERLKSMDDQRRKQFHKYELEKELKHKMMLRAMNEYDRNVQVALDEEDKQKKLDHQKKMKHPGAKAQIEDVWEDEGFEKDNFDAKAFFKMHDIDGNGEWDPYELEAIFKKEVEDLFEGLDDVDEEEKAEEASRMREHVIKHMDKNHDGYVQQEEFILYTKSPDFDSEDPWDSVISESLEDTEFEKFEKELDEKEKKRIEEEAMKEKEEKEKKIREWEQNSKANMDMLKEHSEKLRQALQAAAKARELENAKKLVAEADAAKAGANVKEQTSEQRRVKGVISDNNPGQQRQLAEAQRIEEQRKLAEAQQLEEQKRLAEAQQAEEQRRVAEAQQLEEQRRIAEAQQAEEQRRVAEAQQLEEQRRIAEAQQAEEQRRVSEEQRRAAEAQQLEEQRRIAEAQQAEEQRRVAEAQQLEEQKRIAEAQQAEEQRRVAEAQQLEEQRRIAEAAQQAVQQNVQV